MNGIIVKLLDVSKMSFKSDYLKTMVTLLLALFIVFPGKADELLSQSVNVKLVMNNATVAQVIDELIQQTEYHFSYDTEILKQTIPTLALDMSDEDIETVLYRVFEKTNITFKVNKHNVLLSLEEEPDASADPLARAQQKKSIQGRVTTVEGEPVIGGSVFVKDNPSHGTVTDINGHFRLTNVDEATVLVFTYI